MKHIWGQGLVDKEENVYFFLFISFNKSIIISTLHVNLPQPIEVITLQGQMTEW
jgi:hypothetical protein